MLFLILYLYFFSVIFNIISILFPTDFKALSSMSYPNFAFYQSNKKYHEVPSTIFKASADIIVAGDCAIRALFLLTLFAYL